MKFDTYKITTDHEGLTVENYLKQVLQYSGRKLQKLTRVKGILLNGKKVYLQKKIKPGDTLRVRHFTDNTYGLEPEQGPIDILYEDDYMMVLNKRAGLLVHPAGQTRGGTLANHLAYHLKQQGIVNSIRPLHRLDRDTSGCVIFAKDPRSQFILEGQLQEGVLKRHYWALVKGKVSPPAGTIEAPIGPHPEFPNRRGINAQGEMAVTYYCSVQSFTDATLLELSLETGRTHQIRVHLSYLGYPILGDGMYGVRCSWMKRQALHASSVSFKHLKTNEPITVEAPLAQDYQEAIKILSNPTNSKEP